MIMEIGTNPRFVFPRLMRRRTVLLEDIRSSFAYFVWSDNFLQHLCVDSGIDS